MTFSRCFSLRFRLTLLVMLALLPGFLLAFYMREAGMRYARIDSFEQARRLAVLFSSNGKTLIESGRRVLLAIAQSPEVKRRDIQACKTFFSDILKENPEFADIVAVDGQGFVFSSALEGGEGTSVSDLHWFRRTLDRQTFTVGEPVVARVTGRESMMLAYPVTGAGGGVTVTAVSLDMGWFMHLAQTLPLPPGTTVSIVDREGTFLSRYPENGDWFEKSMPKAAMVLPAMLRDGVDTVEADGVDGQSRLYAMAPLISEPGNEYFIRIGLPAAAAYSGVQADMTRNMSILGVVALLALSATAAFASRFVLRPARQLREAARRLSSGDLNFRMGVPAGRDELTQVAAAFDAMADSLQQSMVSLRRAEEKYRGLFEKSIEGIITTTPDGRIVETNPAFAALLGYASPQELMDEVKNVARDIYIHPEQREAVLAILKERGEASGFVFEARRRDGTPAWLSLNVRTVRDRSGRIEAFESFVTDVTLHKNLEEGLIQAKETAEEANRSKSDFLARMSHEIRTPMSSIIGLTQITLNTKLKEEQRDYLENVLVSAQSLLLLINDILDISKIEAKVLELESIDFCLPRVVGTTLRTLRVQCLEKRLELNLTIDRSVPRYVKGDPGRLRQILINLVGNAIKFTEKGSIQVSVGNVPPEMHHRIRKHDGIPVLFSVEDTGMGIAQEKIEDIFSPFKQGGATVSRYFGGTGLGLTICRQLVEMMGGDIWVHSHDGGGAAPSFSPSASPPAIRCVFSTTIA